MGKSRRFLREWSATHKERGERKGSFEPYYALLLVLAAVALVLLALSRGLGLFAASPVTFVAALVLFAVPGAVLAGLFAGKRDDCLRLPASVPAAFSLSVGLFGLLALPFLVLRWSLGAYLLVCGGVLVLSLLGAAILTLRGALASGTGSERTPDGLRTVWILRVFLATMAAVLGATAVHVFHHPDGDMWAYLGFVQEFSDADQPWSAGGRYALNGWLFEQAALTRLAGLEPVSLVQDHLAPVMVVAALLAIYWLARILFESRTAALVVACVTAILCLVQTAGVENMMGGDLVDHATEDKYVTRFAFLPIALGIATLYARTRAWRYLFLFTFVCWSVVTVHPMGLLLVGVSVSGFSLVHLAFNLRDRQAWWVAGALGTAMASIGLPPALYLLATGNPYLFRMQGVDPRMTFLLDWAQNGERLMVLGDGWYIMHPSFLLNPVILTALVLGVPFLIWRARKDVVAQLLLGMMLFVTFLLYFPPVSTLISAFTDPWSLWRLAWPIELAALLTLGWLAWEAVTFAGSRLVPACAGAVAGFLPLLLIGVLMALAVPSTVAGVRSAIGEEETPQQDSSCTDPAFSWVGERAEAPGTTVLAPDKENSCVPAYSTRLDYVSFRGNQYGEGPDVPRNIADVRKFFESPTLDGEMREILDRYGVEFVLLPANSPLNAQLRHAPGFRPLDNPGERYRIYRVDREKLETTPAMRANDALNDGEFEKAVADYESLALEGDEDERFLANLGLGHAYTKLKMPDEAVASFEEAVELAPGDPGAYRTLAEARAAADDLPGARKALERAVDLSPRNVSLRFELGETLQEMKKEHEAVRQYREVVERFPNVPEYRAELGRALNLTKDFSAADEEFGRAVRLNPRSAALHALLGRSNRASGRLEEAAGYYETALDLDPGNHAYTLQLGSTHAAISTKGGKNREYFDRAERELKEVATSKSGASNKKRAYFSLGALYQRWGKTEDAASAYEKALEIDPRFEPARRNLERVSGA